MYVGLLV